MKGFIVMKWLREMGEESIQISYTNWSSTWWLSFIDLDMQGGEILFNRMKPGFLSFED